MGSQNTDSKTVQLEEFKPIQNEVEPAPKIDPIKAKKDLKILLDWLLTKPLILDESWYLIDAKWLKNTKKFLENSQGNSFPDPIDNSGFLTPSSSNILDGKILNKDFVPVPYEAWQVLVEIFGLKHNFQVTERKVFQFGNKMKIAIESEFFVILKLSKGGEMKNCLYQRINLLKSIQDLENLLKKALLIQNEIRLWTSASMESVKDLHLLDWTVLKNELKDRFLLVDEKIDGNWKFKDSPKFCWVRF